jgi:hypothetical protein
MCIYNLTCLDLGSHHQVGFYAGYESGTLMLKIFTVPENTHNEYCQSLRVTIHGVRTGHQIYGMLTDRNCR